jgi:hypothetical protein
MRSERSIETVLKKIGSTSGRQNKQVIDLLVASVEHVGGEFDASATGVSHFAPFRLNGRERLARNVAEKQRKDGYKSLERKSDEPSPQVARLGLIA